MSELDELVSLVQQKLSRLKREGTNITREHIVAALEKAYEWEPTWHAIPRDAALRVLVERNSVWIGEEKVLEGKDDHVPWLNASIKGNWRYWPRYRLFLASKISETTLDRLDRITDKTLGLLENPERDGSWDRRGLIVGHVQSGKTSNYTGLVCKAADAGYKIIIVLAGMHKNLRSQTQMRLDEGFLGYETNPSRQQLREIGVGLLDPDPAIRPNYVTNRADNGDFSTAVARNLGIRPDQRPWLFVVKKNKTVLSRLLEWVHGHVADTKAGGRPLVTRLPLLLIDDEADHASVDTGQQVFDDEGRPDLEHEPKAINSLIRKILVSFSRSAFVGYTATPFANIFIHEKGRTDEEGDDLFPRSFIMSLPGPSNYAGPVKVFGSARHRGPNGEEGTLGLPLVRGVDDYADSTDEDEREGWMPLRHPNGHLPRIHGEDRLPDTLQEAILSFLIGCAVRRLRGQEREHCSMLVHVTRFNSVQLEVCRQVGEYLTTVRQRLKRGIGAEQLLAECERLWRADFMPTTVEVNKASPPEQQVALPDWAKVQAILSETAEEIQVRTINGTAGDVLDYTQHEGAGLKVIAIGGDKLARGLTLEGLTVSYFLRASKMYDTLMQMGRWFGYRPGYLDVCRLYTTDELNKWFRHITDASEELREEFDHMVSIGGTPKDYGLRVRSHPVLMVTSRVKMRAAKKLLLSYAGDRVETTVLHRDERALSNNFGAAKRFIESLGAGTPNPEQRRPGGKKATWSGSIRWVNVPSNSVTTFLRGYATHSDAWKANAPMIAEFIEKMTAQGELTSWTVALMCGDSRTDATFGSHTVKAIQRKPDERAEGQDESDRYVIRRLLSPRDEAIDLDSDHWEEALNQSRRAAANDPARGDRNAEEIEDPSGPAIRFVRGHGQPEKGISGHPERGLLLIYPLDPVTARLKHGTPPIGLGISFPSSNSTTRVEYAVNNVYWNQEFAAGGLE